MASRITAKQFGAFVRSILPAEPASWLLLCGSTFLFISQSLPWWTRHLVVDWQFRLPAGYAAVLSLPLLVAGAAGYHVAFLWSERPATRLFRWTLLPALASIVGVALAVGVWWAGPAPTSGSILEPSGGVLQWIRRAVQFAANLGTGLKFSVAGLILVVVFFCLLVGGRASVPVCIGRSNHTMETEGMPFADDFRLTMRFVWAMIALVPLATIGGRLIGAALAFTIPQGLDYLQWFRWLETAAFNVCFLVLIWFALGEDGRKEVRQTLRLSEAKYSLLGAFYPVAITSVWPLVQYLHDRIQWASYQWGRLDTPVLSSYFGIPALSSLSYFPAAALEEVAWRGYLQPRFIRRYGLIRGIFLVGIVWGAFHFSSDFAGMYSAAEILRRMVLRLAEMVALSFPLAWLTIRSKSILPAAIAHTANNMLVLNPEQRIYTPAWLLALLWGALGFILFVYFPPSGEAGADAAATTESPEAQDEGLTTA